MNNTDNSLHVRGESQFTDDIPLPVGALYGAVLTSPIAYGEITGLNLATAQAIEGIHGVFTADDIPGENQIGNMINDEPLLAKREVSFIGQPIVMAVGDTPEVVRMAIQAVEITFEEKRGIFDTRESYAKGELICPPVSVTLGNIGEAWQECSVIVEGRVESGGQEHVYLETQSSIAMPTEAGGVKVMTSSQAPRDVQNIIASVLGLAMHNVEVDVLRLGGGFGGKETQATPWAAMAALAAFKTKKSVKLILDRNEDMRITGKRHPYSSDFKMGLTDSGKILAYELTLYQNAGAVADISPAVLNRSILHVTNSYFIPNVKVTGLCCRTNMPPNTAFRGFGAPQVMFVIEAAIFKAAEKMGLNPWDIQKKNLQKENDQFPYGMNVTDNQARQCWKKAEEIYKFKRIRQKN